MKSALEFDVVASSNKARVGKLKLPHYTVDTPIFMPVGTQGTIKGLTSKQVEELDCQIILGNTYHLEQRPGSDIIDEFGGLHKFMNWKRGILTDSGGFQMVSLLDLSKVTEEGVWFRSPHDSSQMLLKPEDSIAIQNKIGADIMMALDDVVGATVTGPRVEEAMKRTIRWLDRCIDAHKKPESQNLFAIVQGGLDPKLRKICLDELIKRDLPGYAIGGLSGGEKKEDFWKIVNQCTDELPENKPRYCMGVGYPIDLVVCVALGVDMFDCVYPSRTARFGTALVPEGTMKLKSNQFQQDFEPIDNSIDTFINKHYTRSFMNTIVTREEVACNLMTMHNISYQMNLMKNIRQAIKDGKFPEFVQDFFEKQFPKKDYPQWAVDALKSVEIKLK